MVFAVKPPVKFVAPDTVPPVNVVLGKFWYVVADIVFAVKPPLKIVAPDTVPPLNGR